MPKTTSTGARTYVGGATASFIDVSNRLTSRLGYFILAVILLLFGAAKLPALAKSMGQSARVFRGEMKAMKEGKLKSGVSGKKVTNPKQAIAIGLSEARRAGKKVPPPPNE